MPGTAPCSTVVESAGSAGRRCPWCFVSTKPEEQSSGAQCFHTLPILAPRWVGQPGGMVMGEGPLQMARGWASWVSILIQATAFCCWVLPSFCLVWLWAPACCHGTSAHMCSRVPQDVLLGPADPVVGNAPHISARVCPLGSSLGAC